MPSNKKQHDVASQGSIEKERDDSESVATPKHYDEREPEPNTQTNPGNEDKGGDEGEEASCCSGETVNPVGLRNLYIAGGAVDVRDEMQVGLDNNID